MKQVFTVAVHGVIVGEFMINVDAGLIPRRRRGWQ